MMLFRSYVGLTALFEVVGMYRLVGLGQPLTEVAPVFVKIHNQKDFVNLWVTFLGILVISRTAFVVEHKNRVIQWLMVALHAAEVPFMMSIYLNHFVPRRGSVDPPTAVVMDIIMGIIVLNPVLFTLYALFGPKSGGAVAKPKAN